MGSQPEPLIFAVDDTVGLRGDRVSVGVVDRSFGDIDSHAPRPQRDYGVEIGRHDGVSRDDFDQFMRTGVPPRRTVLVSWQTKLKTELIPEAKLELLDRALYVGDIVKRRTDDAMSGTVIATNALCTLFPEPMFNSAILNTASATDDHSIRAVPAKELQNVHEFVESALVVYGDWVGRVDQVYDEVAVKLSNNSVVVVENSDDLDYDDLLPDRLSVGDTVRTKKGNLRRGLWRYGAFDPNIRPEGTVVETRTQFIDVHWLARNIGGFTPTSSSLALEPPTRLYRDEFESPNFHIYDASASDASTLPTSLTTGGKSYHIAQVAVGDRVRFQDIAGAAVKYDGSKTLPNGVSQGKLLRVPRQETLGYDMNVYLVTRTSTQVTVKWQDLSVTEDWSPSLIPDNNVEDHEEVWPGEIVFSNEQKTEPGPTESWTFCPAKVGIVQSVKPRDRIATVRWFESPTIQFLDDILIPPSKTGNLNETIENVSLYDINTKADLTRRRGDFVLIHPDCIDSGSLPSNFQGPSWFGEVVDLGLDGKITVRLGAARPVVDVRLLSEQVTLAYSAEMEDHAMGMLDGDTASDDSGSDFDSASFNEMWVEYEGTGREPLGEGDEEDWSTEDEDGFVSADTDTDDSMPDLEPSEGVQTSDTTPEARPHAEHAALPEASLSAPDIPSVEPPTVEAKPSALDGPASFLILDSPPPTDHHYHENFIPAASSTSFMRRIAKEHKILQSSLPPDIFVRTWESRLDLMRVLIIGPSDTPYEFAPFVIDFQLGLRYPLEPPDAFFHSWTQGSGPVNPNLYEDGKICLSLLGTWHADERNESWSPAKSTLLQLLVSIMGLVLVKEPYYNEAGYDIHRQAPETKLNSALYTERAYFRTRGFIVHALSHDVAPFADDLDYFYRAQSDGAPKLLDRAIEGAKAVLERSSSDDEAERDGLRKISLGATVMLKRQLDKLMELKQTTNTKVNGEAGV